MPSASRRNDPVDRFEACAERRKPRGGPAIQAGTTGGTPSHPARSVMKGYEDGPVRVCDYD
jgi:hypothetical protein